MYNPSTFRNTDHETLVNFVQAHPLGVLITNTSEGLLASSIPLLLYPDEADHGVFRAHLSKANPHWKALASGPECLIVFQGSHGYVTPHWYPSKTEHHKVVPTWNYSIVQCRGTPKVIHDAVWLRKQISDLTDFHEKERTNPAPWKVDDAPADFIETQIKAIVGIEIPIRWIEGQFKMSQNRLEQDRLGVINGISDPTDPHYNPDVADVMKTLS
ncbi:FMN-binding negative transcriptional regulator [Xylella taiwanensis]|uniref:FMN-binding negative transcriptional regulator n=1 Tax=Xylella taiwanensis TaxID=1444770 RepID=UPI0005713E05|nr:FMN-binding negative transcriptional regulator [Xylella taiwanensis]AXI82583.1 transcriptional regulator [Xylella taiwanensis]MCD8464622.1 FMN-binding negative transcriptional regulator [Xylella taiwanensis]NBI37568.1 FMN-binding negative transcriptional regulator [Xylella taiwanensis]QKD97592.1 FMN-binding negative transcriptional regulator [Xylella taiwanensis]UFN20531.1 FMN-binding negative transcriptional regulator [Xylella taiwanensis]